MSAAGWVGGGQPGERVEGKDTLRVSSLDSSLGLKLKGPYDFEGPPGPQNNKN